ncbi:MAG: Holliday junction branch migration protein RuvA [Gemmatimonadota bacterium]
MISRIQGRLIRRELGIAEVMTSGGVAYELEVPLSVYERLPREGTDVELRTLQIVREDDITLYGFLDAGERAVFARLLTASGVGPRLALNMLSTLPPDRLVRAILEKDIPTLRQIPGLGAKKAERLAVELADRLDDLAATRPADMPQSRTAEAAVSALTALGYSHADAAAAIRRALDREGASAETERLIRAALGAADGGEASETRARKRR